MWDMQDQHLFIERLGRRERAVWERWVEPGAYGQLLKVFLGGPLNMPRPFYMQHPFTRPMLFLISATVPLKNTAPSYTKNSDPLYLRISPLLHLTNLALL